MAPTNLALKGADAADAPLFVAETARTGRGLFTRRAFQRGELVFSMLGERRVYRSRTAEDAHRYENWLSIGPDLFLDPAEPFVFANHSCEPNLGTSGELDFIALRPIAPGEELTFDYSLASDERPWTMACACGVPGCRKVIRSIHYLPRAVYRRYLPYISDYFQDVYEDLHGARLRSETG